MALRETRGEELILQTARMETPIGPIRLALRDGDLCALGFEERWAGHLRHLERRFGPIRTDEAPAGRMNAIESLERYFTGRVDAIDSLTVDVSGTPFQRRVWSALREVPAGRTISYSALARRIGRASAVRAVGAANAENPVAIVIPCHRVIRSDGSLCGYGGGIERKRWLLAHEGALPGTLPLAVRDSRRAAPRP
jgi:methylated-DNA-[protein]-cysteine S-methyltransferase